MENSNSSKLRKIAFVGPESAGKTTLAKALALKYNDVYVPEFAREYMIELKKKYTISDIEFIAKQQQEHEYQLSLKALNYLFCDTTLLVTKIWAQNAFNNKIAFINDNYNPQNYSIHFLCNIDIPWVFDPLREHPNLKQRQYFFNWYKNELINSNTNFYIVSGNMLERINFCSKIIDAL
jgi:nicotinamide riboside kinase